MIPIIDLLIKNYVEQGLERLRKNPRKIKEYFSYANDKTIKSMEKLITEYKIHVLSGYPKEPIQLPCIVISIAGETEIPYGIGNGIDEGYREFELGNENYLNWSEEHNSTFIQENVQMKAQIRAEVWATDSIVTSFLYGITKYCLLSARNDMENEGLQLIELSGGDLEPAPDYFPEFVYRRATMLDFEYTSSYHVGDLVIGKEEGHIPIGTKEIGVNINGSNSK